MFLNIIFSCVILWVFSFLFVVVDDLIDGITDFIKYKVLKCKVKVHVSSGDIFEDIRLQRSSLRYAYLRVFWFFQKIKNFPEDIYIEAKYFIQRGIRGYSDRDTWDVSHHLTSILPTMIEISQKNRMGYPSGMVKETDELGSDGWPTEEAEKKIIERWKGITEKIIKTFMVGRKITKNEYFYQPSQQYSVKKANRYNMIEAQVSRCMSDRGHAMTKAECREYEEGFKLFMKYFYNLHD